MHDGRGQEGSSFEYGAIFEKNLNSGLSRRLDRDLPFFGVLIRGLSIFQFFFRYFGVNKVKEVLATI